MSLVFCIQKEVSLTSTIHRQVYFPDGLCLPLLLLIDSILPSTFPLRCGMAGLSSSWRRSPRLLHRATTSREQGQKDLVPLKPVVTEVRRVYRRGRHGRKTVEGIGSTSGCGKRNWDTKEIFPATEICLMYYLVSSRMMRSVVG